MMARLNWKVKLGKDAGLEYYYQNITARKLFKMKQLGRKFKILLVEDDLNLGFLVNEYLEENNFEVKLCKDGESGLRTWNSSKFDFCILDIMLPKIDGYTLTRHIRESDKLVPILLLTAKSLKEDKIQGFNLGVDDYLTKPFDEEELLCRINAILNRTNHLKNKVLGDFKIGNFNFDYFNQSLAFGNQIHRLTKTENEILYFLCLSKNKITRRDDLLSTVWGNTDYFTGRSLDVFITKLRKYLNCDSKVKIEGIPTVGYILVDNTN
jgi:DNA-binding response OmpR family regulator